MAKRIPGNVLGKRGIGVAEPLIALLMFSIRDVSAMGQGGGGQSPLGLFVPLLLMFVVLYFFMIRPAQKRQKEKERMLGALKKGDRVVTAGGIHGEIQQVKDQTLVVKIAENVKVELQRGSVSSVISSEESG